ncbi:MAG: hypothetical protein DRR19_14385 [Candidatus Parabeggiatoa sp. nov. 1]|nr:MAG: hypothetical protein DRR19_14385 [Gammaproteobacteria bacterium]
MDDYEIQEIRRIRQQISSENGNNLKAVAKYYRQIEEELKNSGKYKFVEKGYNYNRRPPPQQIT